MVGGIEGRVRSRIPLVDIGQLHRLPRRRLDGFRQLGHRCPLLLVRGGDADREQMPEGVDDGVDLGATGSLVTVIAG